VNPAQMLLITVLSGWTLWHDVAIYHAAGHTRLGGPTYAVTAYETETACHAGQREAMANEERPRRGPLTRRLADGVMVWDPNREHYTTFRYRCAPTGAHVGPIGRP
jgi:hypothetical protein